jgi:hypothetical protein
VCARTVSQLSDADEAGHVLVEDLETAAVFLWLAWVAEATRSIQDAAEGVKVDYIPTNILVSAMISGSRSRFSRLRLGVGTKQRTVTAGRLLQVGNLGEGWVLAACAQQVAERVDGDATGATLVEQ